ncbi:MAG TPA: hypothetical protein DCS93_43820 [Microscillaceae bacterium]|nr:hypothetical protein [Microscillaceae bacterium]
MYRRLTQTLSALMAKAPQGKASITFEDAPNYAAKFDGQVHLYQEPPPVSQAAPPIPLGYTLPSSLIQHFQAGSKITYLDFTHPGFRFCLHHLIDPDNHVVYHPGINFQDLAIARQKLPTKLKELKGTVAYVSHAVAGHYGHWMRTVLPSLQVYQKYLSLDAIDYFYIGDLPVIPPFILECFDFLGIPTHKIVHYPCKGSRTLITLTESEAQMNGFNYIDHSAYQFTRTLVNSQLDLTDNCCYNPRVYITRGNVDRRQVKNEAAVFELLREYDVEFRVLDQISIREQAQIFYHADVIIAPHGSALTNLIFGRESGKVLELFGHNYINNTFFGLATHSKMQYFYMKGLDQPATATAPRDEDIMVDLISLEDFCKTYFL